MYLNRNLLWGFLRFWDKNHTSVQRMNQSVLSESLVSEELIHREPWGTYQHPPIFIYLFIFMLYSLESYLRVIVNYNVNYTSFVTALLTKTANKLAKVN